MEDVPQPAPEPYSIGERVRVYVAEDDPDRRFHGSECVVVDRFEDSLGGETGRALDRYSYRVRPADGDNPLPVGFRHFDLVPIAENE
ncbi:hypothetical protein GS429_15865 [Natronorubrum sp. JWXQ-INN-674]|uniref:DUF8139 domain-containing protein n=1 Tax=Natronorubrum halalkaliphilum TaxID=2691917 RepID=A0A6B0VQC8_9EURY|nr:hypothetical protein [Natronorubrum halalkaliphilum]MXV63505.1 hypothetical protein [Natronorubrum halalkaliphilum]